jgi:hypothetical protein
MYSGKIYKISSSGGLPYYGSTCLSLAKRFQLHLKNGNKYSVKIHLEQPDIKIELIENFPCESKTDLLIRERFHIENNECCNKRRPYRSKKEQMIYQNNYFNTDYWKEYHKIYNKTRYLRVLPFYLGI